MINIDGIQVDIATSIDSLSNKWAVFTIEFEFDNRLIVCHTFNQSVYEKIQAIFHQVLSSNTKRVELRQALINSKYITVAVEERELQSESEVLAKKYGLVKANKTYLPHGYNTLILPGNALEQDYINALRQELIYEMDKESNLLHIYNTSRKKGRLPKRVYGYDKESGLLVKEYASVTEAAESTGIHASNISACCTGRIKTAGQYRWSYVNRADIDEYYKN